MPLMAPIARRAQPRAETLISKKRRLGRVGIQRHGTGAALGLVLATLAMPHGRARDSIISKPTKIGHAAPSIVR